MTDVSKEDLARQLWAIGDIVRLRILDLLPPSADCQDANNVSALAEQLGLTQPTISHHLLVLRQAGLVEHKKMCRDCYYWVTLEAAEAVLRNLRDTLSNPHYVPVGDEKQAGVD